MKGEKKIKTYRAKVRAVARNRKRKIKLLKQAQKRKKSWDKNKNIRMQLKEQLSPTFSRAAYMPDHTIAVSKKDVLKVDKFNMNKWQPKPSVDK